MDTDALAMKLREISDSILEEHGSANLIMLLGNSNKEHTTAFDYVISAKWLNNLNVDEGLDIILDYLYSSLSEEEIAHISRVTIVHSTDIIVQSMTAGLNVSGGISVFEDCRFGNLVIPFVIAFEIKQDK